MVYIAKPTQLLTMYLLIYQFVSWYVFPKVIFHQHFTYLFTFLEFTDLQIRVMTCI